MTPAGTKRVLMVAFHYPPDLSSSGVLRTLKFSRYLPEYGWQPTVLTVRESSYESTDPALLGQVPPGVKVRRTRAVNTKKTFSFRGKYLKFYTIPDSHIGWLPFAVRAGLQMIRQERIDAIYSTSPLATTHLIASTLKFMSGRPWVADFRDPWTEPEIAANPRAPLFRLECRLERGVLRHADRLIFTTAQLRDTVMSRHQDVDAAKAVVIPNGYDEEDFLGLNSSRPDSLPIRITHTGLVDESYRSPQGFLAALAELLKRGEIQADQIRIDFLGGGKHLRSPAFQSLVQSLGLEKIVTVYDRVSYAECLEQQARSHALLLLQCGLDTRTLIPAKAFEYLRIGRPILALAPPGATSELFERVGGAHLADPRDALSIENVIREVFCAARAGQWESDVNRDALRSYTRRELTGRLASELDRLTAK